jgi:hypothetical protein
MSRWNRDRDDISLFKPINLSANSAYSHGFRSTPSLLIAGLPDTASMQDEVEASLEKDIQALATETSVDVPVLKVG